MRIRWSIVSVSLLSLLTSAFLLGCGDDAPQATVPSNTMASAMPSAAPVPQDKDIVDTAMAAGKFNTLAAAIKAAGLVDTLKGPGPYTVFAPTDDAFSKVSKDTLDGLMKPENKDKLTQLLTYHVIAGKLMAADVSKMASAKTVNGKEVGIKVDGSTVTIGGATVVQTDISASNGVIHVIDTVLMPPEDKKVEPPAQPDVLDTAAKAGELTMFAKAVDAAGLTDTLKSAGPFTVFAPNDKAFDKIKKADLDKLLADKEKLKNVLTYHVVAGRLLAADVATKTSATTVEGDDMKIKADKAGVVMLDGKAKVIKTDIAAGNGVIHVIDTVLMPKKKTAMATPAPATGGKAPAAGSKAPAAGAAGKAPAGGAKPAPKK